MFFVRPQDSDEIRPFEARIRNPRKILRLIEIGCFQLIKIMPQGLRARNSIWSRNVILLMGYLELLFTKNKQHHEICHSRKYHS